jgi:hypothetical protein
MVHKKQNITSILVILVFFLIICTSIIPSSSIQSRYNYLNTHNSYLYPNEIIGKDSTGNVVKYGPYGNKSSKIKIAFIIGVHPLEQKSHTALLEALLKNQGNLKYSYYIYAINVQQNREDYNKSRINGQALAYKYVVPDIKNNNFKMAVDIHSNQGKYREKYFVFSPMKDKASLKIARFLVGRVPGLVYYTPPRTNEPTSVPYVTEPLVKGGVPAVVYEAYLYEPYFFTEAEAEELVKSLNQMKIP